MTAEMIAITAMGVALAGLSAYAHTLYKAARAKADNNAAKALKYDLDVENLRKRCDELQQQSNAYYTDYRMENVAKNKWAKMYGMLRHVACEYEGVFQMEDCGDRVCVYRLDYDGERWVKVAVKRFAYNREDPADKSFAYREASELLDKLNES